MNGNPTAIKGRSTIAENCKQFINHLFMFLVETPTTTPGLATTPESPQRRTTPGPRFHPPSPTLLPMLLVFSLKLDQWLAKKWAKLVVMLMRKYVEVVAAVGLDQIRFNPLVPLCFNPQQLKDGNTMNEIQTQVTGIGSKVADFSRKGWQDISTFFNKKVSSYNDPNESSMPSSQSYANFGNSSYQNEDMPRSNTSASLSNGRGGNSTKQYNSSGNTKDWENWWKRWW